MYLVGFNHQDRADNAVCCYTKYSNTQLGNFCFYGQYSITKNFFTALPSYSYLRGQNYGYGAGGDVFANNYDYDRHFSASTNTYNTFAYKFQRGKDNNGSSNYEVGDSVDLWVINYND